MLMQISKTKFVFRCLIALLLEFVIGAPTWAQEFPSSNVVKVEVFSPDGQVISSGFGFATAQDGSLVTAATASHVIRERRGDPLGEVEVRLSGFPNYVGRATLLDSFSSRSDLAAFRFSAPAGYKMDPFVIDGSDLTVGESAWALEPGRWVLPVLPGAYRFRREGRLIFEGLGVAPGSSGGPAVTKRGVVGLVVRDQDPLNTHVLPITDVAALFGPANWNLPWQLKSWDFDQSNEIVALSKSLSAVNPQQALKLAIAAWPRSVNDEMPPTSGAISALRMAMKPVEVEPMHVLRPGSSWVSVANFSPDGRYIVTFSPSRGHVWDSRRGRKITGIISFPSTVLSATFSPDGRRLALAGLHDEVWLVSYTPGSEYGLFLEIDGSSSRAVAFSPDGRRFASADKHLHVWDVESGHRIAKSGRIDCCFVNGVAFISGGREIVTVSGPPNGSVVIWDVGSATPVTVLAQDNSLGFETAAVSRDSNTLVTGSIGGGAEIWDLVSRGKRANIIGHEDDILSAAFSPNGTTVATGSSDFTARVWNARNGESLAELVHDGNVSSLEFSPSGKLLATAADSGKIHVWDTATWAHLLSLNGHSGKVNDLSFSPNAEQLVSGSSDETAMVWDLASLAGKSSFQIACERLENFSLREFEEIYDLAIDRPICREAMPAP